MKITKLPYLGTLLFEKPELFTGIELFTDTSKHVFIEAKPISLFRDINSEQLTSLPEKQLYKIHPLYKGILGKRDLNTIHIAAYKNDQMLCNVAFPISKYKFKLVDSVILFMLHMLLKYDEMKVLVEKDFWIYTMKNLDPRERAEIVDKYAKLTTFELGSIENLYKPCRFGIDVPSFRRENMFFDSAIVFYSKDKKSVAVLNSESYSAMIGYPIILDNKFHIVSKKNKVYNPQLYYFGKPKDLVLMTWRDVIRVM